ncbi:shikimate 5-dehydrogenase [Deinococcus alpinitundrae]|uniref:shikimate 5-dehydrogenase n=1 Tax=Deinococcus alpinitundrae TaxID=468913 RepID=UPI001379D3E4|nr:shikimate 5-dehydrogenase [Deinococcus alpinitundrae]
MTDDAQTLISRALSLNKDTQLCISLAARPGNFGTRFHNFLYAELGLDYVYKAMTTRDLAAALGGVRALGIRGCAVSMPFKESCIPFLDELTPSAAAIHSVNTIVNEDGYLRAYNTDYLAVQQLIAEQRLSPDLSFALRGSGGMARAVTAAFRDAGFRQGLIVSRNAAAGQALAHEYGYPWQAELIGSPELLINVTPIGMADSPEADALAFAPDAVQQARTIFDVVALPAETPLIQAGRAAGKQIISSEAVSVRQALEQFVLYTGVRPSAEQVGRAAAFARR